MKRITGIRSLAISALVLAVPSAAAVMMVATTSTAATATLSPAAAPGRLVSDDPPAPTNPAEMPMDMPGMDMSGSSPAPTSPPDTSGGMDMPGMDMPGSHEHGDATGPAAHRPLAPVLGTFGGGTAAVLLTAGMMRRKDHASSLAKKAARITGRAKK